MEEEKSCTTTTFEDSLSTDTHSQRFPRCQDQQLNRPNFCIGVDVYDELSNKYNQQLKRHLKQCIMKKGSDITFDDVAGNEYAKEVLNETFVLPALMPKLFKGAGPKPWQSILIYGPPGVGKTMLL